MCDTPAPGFHTRTLFTRVWLCLLVISLPPILTTILLVRYQYLASQFLSVKLLESNYIASFLSRHPKVRRRGRASLHAATRADHLPSSRAGRMGNGPSKSSAGHDTVHGTRQPSIHEGSGGTVSADLGGEEVAAPSPSLATRREGSTPVRASTLMRVLWTTK